MCRVVTLQVVTSFALTHEETVERRKILIESKDEVRLSYNSYFNVQGEFKDGVHWPKYVIIITFNSQLEVHQQRQEERCTDSTCDAAQKGL